MPRATRDATLPFLLLLALAAAAASLSYGSRSTLAQGEEDADRPSPAQVRAQIQDLIAQYRSAKPDLDRRAEIVGEILELGDEGARRAVAELAKDFRSRDKSYPAKFAQAAAKVMEQRAKDGDFKREVARLRQEVLAVSRDPGMTKEKIEGRADPARHDLEQMLSLSPDQVLESDESLQRERETLVQCLQWWRNAIGHLPEAEAKALADPKNKAAPPLPPEQEAFERELTATEATAATLAAIPDRGDRTIFQSNRDVAKKLDPAEAQGLLALNLLRARLGIGALAIDPKLCAASRDHAKDMVEHNFFDHASPVSGKSTPWDRAKLAGTSAAAENIYFGSERGEDAIESWWHSPGHHANMMAPHKRVGLGRHQGHWTLMFGG